MSFPQGPGNGNNPNPNNNRNNGNPFTNPFNRGNNGNNGKGNNNENRPIWQSPWLWGAVLVVMVVLMFQMFAGGGTKTIDTKDGFALINQGKATYAEITDNKQVVRLKLKNDYTKKNADTGKVTNYGKNVQFYYTFAQGAQVAKAVENGNLEKGWTSNIEQTSMLSYLVTSILPFIIFFALFWFLMSRMGGAGGMLGMGGKKNSGKLLDGQTPTTKFADVAGEDEAVAEVEEIKDFLKDPSKYKALGARIPRGVLLYGPPGNGKTMIAKAVANSLAARAAALNPGSNTRGYFLNIKGPELLDKFVGETERQIRDIFVAAREKAEAGHPVVVFFDEMESLFRMRGSGRSSDIETTIVPQLLAEIDGVESLQNVIVIGATNREDLIDAAVMRPGRLDLKIRINRPDAAGAAEIFGLYLTEDLPLDAAEVAAAGSVRAALTSMIAAATGQLYARTPSTAYAVATVDSSMIVGASNAATGHLSTHTLYRGDFASGAVIRNIVDRAKKAAIKEQLQALTAGADATGVGIGTRHLLEAVRAEFEDQVDLPPLPDIEDALTVAGVRGRLVSVEPAR